jgi:hypothetical protein
MECHAPLSALSEAGISVADTEAVAISHAATVMFMKIDSITVLMHNVPPAEI